MRVSRLFSNDSIPTRFLPPKSGKLSMGGYRADRKRGGLKRGWKQIGHPPLDLLSRRFLSIRLSSFLVKRNPRYMKHHLSGSFSLLARLHASSGFIERHLLNVIFMHIKDEEGGGGGSLMELERVGRLFAKPYLSFVWMDCVGG